MAHNPYRKPPFGGCVRKKASNTGLIYRPLEIDYTPVLIDGMAIYIGA